MNPFNPIHPKRLLPRVFSGFRTTSIDGTSLRKLPLDDATLFCQTENLSGTGISSLLGDKPILLRASETCRDTAIPWPSQIRMFVLRAEGIDPIMASAIHLAEAPESERAC